MDKEKDEHIHEVEDDEDDHHFNENLISRFYRKDFPEENDLVITEIVKVHENGAYVVLLEYENMEGLILSTEVTKKRGLKPVNKFMKIGKQETMMVIRVDKDKRYIDLSKKKVQPEEAANAEKHFKKAKMVHNILKQVAVKLNVTLKSLYEAFAWDLYDKFEHAYDAFRLIMSDPDSVFSQISITEEQKKVLIESIARKMAPTPIKLRADFELTCFTYEGIDAIRDALLAAKKVVNEDTIQVSFKMIAPPHYKCECVTLEKAKGIAKLEESLKLVEAAIKERKGTFKLVNKPQVIGAKDDKDIEDIMAKINDDREDGGSSAEEDNEEGIDIDLEDDGEGEEEKKEDKKGKKTKKKAQESDENNSDDEYV